MNKMTWNHLVGLPARITLASRLEVATSPQIRLHGVVSLATEQTATFDLIQPFNSSQPIRADSVEILHPDGLIRFNTREATFRIESHRIYLTDLSNAQMEWVQRRKKVRANVRLACQISRASVPDQAQSRPGIIQNLSAGGLVVEVQSGFSVPVGDRLVVQFAPTPWLGDCTFHAEVVRVTSEANGGNLLALRFKELTIEQEESLTTLVEEANQLPGHATVSNLPVT